MLPSGTLPTQVRCLNEATPGSAGERLFRPWDQRLDFSGGAVASDEDAELIITVPFSVDVKLRCMKGRQSSPLR